MIEPSPNSEFRHVQRRIRLVAILDAAETAGLSPMHLLQLHTVAYLADALAPVWGLRILDAQLLKQRGGPMSPVLQQDLDALVGQGVVVANSVRHVATENGGWRLEAQYSLNRAFADRILDRLRQFEQYASSLAFVREVVYAVSALGANGVTGLSRADAAYGDPVVDVGGLLDIAGSGHAANRTVQVAMRFGDLMRSEIDLTNSEKIHLYVRALYDRLTDAA